MASVVADQLMFVPCPEGLPKDLAVKDTDIDITLTITGKA